MKEIQNEVTDFLESHYLPIWKEMKENGHHCYFCEKEPLDNSRKESWNLSDEVDGYFPLRTTGYTVGAAFVNSENKIVGFEIGPQNSQIHQFDISPAELGVLLQKKFFGFKLI